MGNREHIQVLKQGVVTWNTWRTQSPSVEPNLSGMNLRPVMLRNFRDANLSNANLSGADLRDANLRHADLSGARLHNAQLHRANISNARLYQTSFKQAVLYETIFANVDLSIARYLETCLHKGPSILDHRTLARSGRLPIEFLRGCGLPDFLINEAPAFQRNLNRYCSCFISYSSKDQEFVGQLHTDLQSKGVRCWFAPKDLKIGDKFRAVIDEAIRGTEKLLLILSENAISSTWVEKEVETAFEEESRRGQVVLFPIRLDDTVMKTEEAWASDIRRIRHIGDFSSWKEYNKYELAFSQLLRGLQTERSTKQALVKRADRA